jgi:hypothetical protein
MKYRRAYTIAFQHPNWLTTILLLTVCILIPIVGVMVLLGYRAELMDRWIDDDADGRQKPFDFNRFSDLLSRGIAPFLYQLILGLAFGVVLGVMYFSLVMLLVMSNEPALFFIGLAFFYLCLFVVQILVKVLTWPFVLHGQIVGKFDFGAAWTFAKDFYSKIGLTNLLGIALLCIILDILCFIAGAFLFCVGMYAALPVIMLAENHILWQLYNKYLDQGGRTLPRYERPGRRDVERDEEPSDRV